MQINYKSDFDFIFRLADSEGNDAGFPSYDWIATFYTSNKNNAYVASSIGGVLTNCYNDSGAIHIVVDSHKMGIGELRVEFRADLPNGIYPDGLQTEVTPQALDITLVSGAGDTAENITAEIVLPYAVVDAYAMAVSYGYDGTQEDYVTSLAALPDIANVITDISKGKAYIAEALTAQNISTTADEALADMADKIKTLYSVPNTSEGSRDCQTLSGEVKGMADLVNICNRSKRADLPYNIGISFVTQYDNVILGKADACLLSDGTEYTDCEGIEHTFTDGEMTHWAVYYFAEDFFLIPWCDGDGVVHVDIACVDGHPTSASATAKTFVNFFCDAEPVDYNGYDFAFGSVTVSNITHGGVSSLPSGESVTLSGQVGCIDFPNLVSTYRPLAPSATEMRCYNLPMLEYANTGYNNSNKWLIPNSSHFKQINLPNLKTFIYDTICRNNSAVTSVNLPKLETLAGGHVCYESGKVTSISVPSLSSMTGGNVAYNCSSLTEISVPSLSSMTGGNVAYNCSSLTEISVPSLSSMTGGYVAYNCSALTELSVPSLSSMTGGNVAKNCSSLTEISVPSLSSMTGGYVAYNCSSLTELELPELTKATFSNSRFVQSCAALKSLLLPKLESASGNGGLFGDALSLEYLYIPKLVSLVNGNMTWGTTPTSLHVKLGSQQGASLYLSYSFITKVTIDEGFTGTLYMSAASLTIDDVREIINNLGDNSKGTSTYTIQISSTLLAQLTEDEIAIATNKNYTVKA